MNLFDHFISWLYVRRLFGSRCPTYNDLCACCEQWRSHDELFNKPWPVVLEATHLHIEFDPSDVNN